MAATVNRWDYSGVLQKILRSEFGDEYLGNYAQIIDDVTGNTLVSCSTMDKEVKDKISVSNNCEASSFVGEVIAKRSIQNKISSVKFDRGGRIYHGRIKALADAARKEGLNF